MSREFIIVSPEKVSLEYRLAGLGSRVLAEFVDVLLWFVIWFILLLIGIYVFGMFSQIGGPLSLMADAFLVTWIVVGVVTSFAYPILFEIQWNGQTPGKRMFGLRVMMDNGAPIDAAAAIKRGLARVLDGLLLSYFVGAVMMFFSARNQRIGDMIAGTVVVQERKHLAPSVMRRTFELEAPAESSEHPLASCVGSIDAMTAEDYRMLKHFLERRPELPSELQQRFASQMLMPLISRLDITVPPGTPAAEMLEAVVSRYARVHGLLG